MDQEYDDSPWTDEEIELLAWEAGAQAGWEDMDDYDRSGILSDPSSISSTPV